MKPVAIAVFRPRLATCAFVLVRCLQHWFLVLFFRKKKQRSSESPLSSPWETDVLSLCNPPPYSTLF